MWLARSVGVTAHRATSCLVLADSHFSLLAFFRLNRRSLGEVRRLLLVALAVTQVVLPGCLCGRFALCAKKKLLSALSSFL